MVNDGNDDKAELYDPANYNLENAVNVYFDGYQRAEDRMGGWFMSPSTVQGSCTKQDCQDNIFSLPNSVKTTLCFFCFMEMQRTEELPIV